jgi:hypothetical protein
VLKIRQASPHAATFLSPMWRCTPTKPPLPSLKMLDYDVVGEQGKEGEPLVVLTRLVVKLQLNLPWKPVLAWVWGVRHEFDPASLQQVRSHHQRTRWDTRALNRHAQLLSQQTVHKESWEVSAGEGVRQLFSPGSEVVRSKIPPVGR